MLEIHPKAGLTRGGTQVEVVGLDFRYMPQYGVVPHCRFGDKIVRATFDSTVRIVCTTPPNVAQQGISFEVSLNSVDWTDSKFTYSYYEEPKIESMFPDAGPANGGTEVYFTGKNFPKLNDTEEFNCRFTPVNVDMPPKKSSGKYINETSIYCATPGGWTKGDKMKLQVTFNGGDYDNNNYEFTVYNIEKAFPRSGPSDGNGGEIVVSGQGFI